MSRTVFIDGGAGTTGLELAARLAPRRDFTLIALAEHQRKDPQIRRAAFHEADFAVLCLPDEAAREALALAEGSKVRIIDASSAHRVAPGWIYGFPEVIGRERVAGATRLSNPGCYSTGFIALLAPLVRQGLLPADWPYGCHAISGYSGGGKAQIGRFADDPDLAHRAYALELAHKHAPEMQVHSALAHRPLFSPSVIRAYRGMMVEILLPLAQMPQAAPVRHLRAGLADFYAGSAVVTVHQAVPGELLLRGSMAPSDRLDLWAIGSSDGTQARLIARFDNLGKGASGAAVQNLNLMAGLDETTGLAL